MSVVFIPCIHGLHSILSRLQNNDSNFYIFQLIIYIHVFCSFWCFFFLLVSLVCSSSETHFIFALLTYIILCVYKKYLITSVSRAENSYRRFIIQRCTRTICYPNIFIEWVDRMRTSTCIVYELVLTDVSLYLICLLFSFCYYIGALFCLFFLNGM